MKDKCKKCGKEFDNAIVINTNMHALARYLEWKNENNGLCLNCYINS